MKDNWERAFDVGINKEDYVFFLGDDDGLMPSALRVANTILEATGTEILSWRKADYCWPTLIVSEDRNVGYLPLGNTVSILSSNEFLLASHNFDMGYDFGPSVYASFVKMSVLLSLRQVLDGIFFRSGAPDVFSSYALASEVDFFARCDFPLSVNGGSRHSNGISYIHAFGGEINRAYTQSFQIHPKVVAAPSVYITEADALLRVRDALPSRFASFSFSAERLVMRLRQESQTLRASPRSEAIFAAATQIASLNRVSISSVHASSSPEAAPTRTFGFSSAPPSLTLNLASFQAYDVSEAARIYGSITPLLEKQWKIKKVKSGKNSLHRRVLRKLGSLLMQF